MKLRWTTCAASASCPEVFSKTAPPSFTVWMCWCRVSLWLAGHDEFQSRQLIISDRQRNQIKPDIYLIWPRMLMPSIDSQEARNILTGFQILQKHCCPQTFATGWEPEGLIIWDHKILPEFKTLIQCSLHRSVIMPSVGLWHLATWMSWTSEFP